MWEGGRKGGGGEGGGEDGCWVCIHMTYVAEGNQLCP